MVVIRNATYPGAQHGAVLGRAKTPEEKKRSPAAQQMLDECDEFRILTHMTAVQFGEASGCGRAFVSKLRSGAVVSTRMMQMARDFMKGWEA